MSFPTTGQANLGAHYAMLRGLSKARIDPACFRGSGIDHLDPLAFPADDAKLFAFWRDPKQIGVRRWGFPYINVDRDPNSVVLA